MSLRIQNLLATAGVALALLIGSCESPRIGAGSRQEPGPSVQASCTEEVAT